MLRRKSMPLPLPASPRGAARDVAQPQRESVRSRPMPHHNNNGPSNGEVCSRIVRSVGSDPSTPFWHFVRKNGPSETTPTSPDAPPHRPSDGHHIEKSDTISTSLSARDVPKSGLVGLRGVNTPHAATSVRLQNDKASLFIVAPGQRFMAHEPKHAMSIPSGRRTFAL